MPASLDLLERLDARLEARDTLDTIERTLLYSAVSTMIVAQKE